MSKVTKILGAAQNCLMFKWGRVSRHYAKCILVLKHSKQANTTFYFYEFMSWNNENSNDNLWIIYALWIFWIQESFKHLSLLASIQSLCMNIIFHFNFDTWYHEMNYNRDIFWGPNIAFWMDIKILLSKYYCYTIF